MTTRFAGAVTVALASGLMACPAPMLRPTRERKPLQSDIERCAAGARAAGTATLKGALTVALLVDVDGAVPAAFIHDAAGLDSRDLGPCIAELFLSAKLPAEGLDSLRLLPVTLGGAKEAPAAPLDEKLAQDTLAFADWATPVDRGWGHLLAGRPDEAVKQLRGALQSRPQDVRALRGLALALAASGQLTEARALAAKAVQLRPNSEATHEALLRVCLAAGDDACVRDELDKAQKAPDSAVRKSELQPLEAEAKAAAARLAGKDQRARDEAAAEARRADEQAQRKLDPHGCKKLEGDARTLCHVKGCFDKGGRAYAEGLQELTGHRYMAGSWSLAAGAAGAAMVTLAIRAAGGLPHDASWEVKAGEGADDKPHLKPLDIDANNITNQYNTCGK